MFPPFPSYIARFRVEIWRGQLPCRRLFPLPPFPFPILFPPFPSVIFSPFHFHFPPFSTPVTSSFTLLIHRLFCLSRLFVHSVFVCKNILTAGPALTGIQSFLLYCISNQNRHHNQSTGTFNGRDSEFVRCTMTHVTNPLTVTPSDIFQPGRAFQLRLALTPTIPREYRSTGEPAQYQQPSTPANRP